jgi:hypothetical protein
MDCLVYWKSEKLMRNDLGRGRRRRQRDPVTECKCVGGAPCCRSAVVAMDGVRVVGERQPSPVVRREGGWGRRGGAAVEVGGEEVELRPEGRWRHSWRGGKRRAMRQASQPVMHSTWKFAFHRASVLPQPRVTRMVIPLSPHAPSLHPNVSGSCSPANHVVAAGS